MTIVFYSYHEHDYKSENMLRTAERLFNKTIREWYNLDGARCKYSKGMVIMTVEIKPEHAWPIKDDFNRRLMRIHEWNTSECYEFEWIP